MKKLILALVLCLLPFNLAAQQTTIGGGGGGWDGTADAIYSITPFSIMADTLDGADNKSFYLCSGGACDFDRGAYIGLTGDDSGGAGAGGGIYYEAGDGALGYHTFATNGYIDLTLGNPDSDDVDLVFGRPGLTTAPVYTFKSVTVDGDDDGQMHLTPGGAVGTTRSSYLSMYANESASAGDFIVGTGDAAGSDYFLYTNGNLRLTVPYLADADNADFILGVNATTAPDFNFRAQTSNADDDALLRMAAGGAAGTDRGAQIEAYGNERTGGNGGLLRLMVGEVANSMLEMYAGGRKWHVPYNATATIGDFVYGPAGTANFIATIRHGRADTEDNGTLQMTGGGSSTLSGTRGAYIQAEGADVGGAGAGGDLVLAAASTGGFIKFTGGLDPKGSTSNLKNVACEEITIPVGSGSDPVVTSGTNLCASGIIVSVGARVTQAPGGGATTLDVGCTGSGNLDQFIDGISTALSTTGAYPTNGDGTNTVWVQKTATTLTLSTDADVTTSDMKARICVYYMDTTAPTS